MNADESYHFAELTPVTLITEDGQCTDVKVPYSMHDQDAVPFENKDENALVDSLTGQNETLLASRLQMIHRDSNIFDNDNDNFIQRAAKRDVHKQDFIE
ncbi:MAG: hypothetical protein AB2541_09290 [Candidatus Thiodiazotropha sp.]